MYDPRKSADESLRRALAAWDSIGIAREAALITASQLREKLAKTDNHVAYAWACLISGSVAAYQENLSGAELLLAEAAGRFHLIDDRYGEGLTESHIGIVQAQRGNLDSALRFVQRPFASGVDYAALDLSVLHNNAAMCYCQREQSHEAIGHLIKEYELIKSIGARHRIAVVLGNIAAVLINLGQLELSLVASERAWQLQLGHKLKRERDIGALGNIIISNNLLERFGEVLRNGRTLEDHVAGDESLSWNIYLILVDVHLHSRDIGLIKRYLDLARARAVQAAHCQTHLRIGEATLLAATNDHHSAINLLSQILEQPVGFGKRIAHLQAALIHKRSCIALGRDIEAQRSRKLAEDICSQGFLGNILSSQIRQSLQSEEEFKVNLTDQELRCLSLSALGQTSADIGLKLGITPRTVNFHFSKIYRKLNAVNRQEAIAKAVSADLIKQPRQSQIVGSNLL